MNQEVKILRPSIIKTIALLIVSIIFVYGGIILRDENQFMAWLIIIFFGLGTIVFVIQLIPNSSYLKLTKEGFEVKSLYKTNFTKWSDIDVFTTGYISKNLMVLFNYSNNHNKYNTGKKLAKSIAGNEGALPNNYGMKAKNLAILMNEWKSKNTTVA